jgi:hypothetical protein
MTTTRFEFIPGSDLAAALEASARLEAEAEKTAARAAEAKRKAQAATEQAQERREQARRRWAERVWDEFDGLIQPAIERVSEARAAFYAKAASSLQDAVGLYVAWGQAAVNLWSLENKHWVAGQTLGRPVSTANQPGLPKFDEALARAVEARVSAIHTAATEAFNREMAGVLGMG